MVKPLLPERPMAAAVFQILIALADQPLHGYGIMLDIAERSDGKVKLSPTIRPESTLKACLSAHSWVLQGNLSLSRLTHPSRWWAATLSSRCAQVPWAIRDREEDSTFEGDRI